MSATIEPKERMTKRRVQARLRDWERRIDALFAQIEDWTKHMRDRLSVSKGVRQQRNEQMMREFGVAPRKLPTLTVHGLRRTIELVPSCLWIIGANGRVDVSVVDPSVKDTKSASYYTLFDMGGEGEQPSDWQLVNRDPKIVLEPFTRDAFQRIAELG